MDFDSKRKELKERLKNGEINQDEYYKSERELTKDEERCKDDKNIGYNIKVIKICVIIITAILCVLALTSVIVSIGSMSSTVNMEDMIEDDYEYGSFEDDEDI